MRSKSTRSYCKRNTSWLGYMLARTGRVARFNRNITRGNRINSASIKHRAGHLHFAEYYTTRVSRGRGGVGVVSHLAACQPDAPTDSPVIHYPLRQSITFFYYCDRWHLSWSLDVTVNMPPSPTEPIYFLTKNARLSLCCVKLLFKCPKISQSLSNSGKMSKILLEKVARR